MSFGLIAMHCGIVHVYVITIILHTVIMHQCVGSTCFNVVTQSYAQKYRTRLDRVYLNF